MSLRAAFLALTVLVLAPSAGAAGAAGAQTGGTVPGAADQARIEQVIRDQMSAFRRDDGAAAFAHASPTIQRKFGDPAAFMAMVRTGYAPVYRPRHVEFRDLVELRGAPAQQVLVIGPDGNPVMAVYSMERQPDGTWRISGCVLLPLAGDSA